MPPRTPEKANEAKPPRSSNPQVQRTKSHILETTLNLLAESGYRDVTIDLISVRSKVSRSTIYRHWPSLNDLLFDAFAGMVGEPFESPDTGDYKTDLLVIQKQYAKSLDTQRWVRILPSLIEIAENDDHFAELLATMVENARKTTKSILAQAKKSGQIPKKTNLDWATDIISAPLTYRALLSKAPTNEKGYLEYLINAAINGVETPAT